MEPIRKYSYQYPNSNWKIKSIMNTYEYTKPENSQIFGKKTLNLRKLTNKVISRKPKFLMDKYTSNEIIQTFLKKCSLNSRSPYKDSDKAKGLFWGSIRSSNVLANDIIS